MPTYEYACSACGHHLDHFQSMSDPPIRKCPKCGKLRLKKLISAGAGVIFKGSGFYTTDYRSSSYNSSKKSDVEPVAPAPKTESKDAKTDSKSDSKSDAKSDSKPETKVESKPEKAPAPPPSKKPKGKK